MPNRILQARSSSPSSDFAGRAAPKVAEFNANRRAPASHTVKKLVRSLSDRYAAVTSPLTCKKKSSCSTTTPSLKMMKTTAATSMLPLKPNWSASSKPKSPMVNLTETVKKEPRNITPSQKTHTLTAAVLHPTKTLSDMQSLSCINFPASKPRRGSLAETILQGNHKKLKKLTIRAPASSSCANSSAMAASSASLQFISLSVQDNDVKQNTKKSSNKTLLVKRLTQSHRFPQLLSNNDKDRSVLEWQQLETLLKLKDDELESIQTAGLMLKDLCMRQDEEIQMLKAAFPATLKEMAQLRGVCETQERELAYSRVVIPTMQAQISALTDQLKSLTEDLAQMKACKEASSSERVSSHFHEREASNSTSSTLSIEPSPLTNGFLEQLTRSRRWQHDTTPEDQKLLPVTICEAASSSCSSVMEVDQSSETLSENKRRHRRVFNAVLSVEHMLKGNGKKSGRKLATDKEIIDTLHALDKAADKEQALLQERCANVFKDLRSSSSRFVSLEPLKSILTCASPQLFEDPPDYDQEIYLSPKVRKMAADSWNLKPT